MKTITAIVTLSWTEFESNAIASIGGCDVTKAYNVNNPWDITQNAAMLQVIRKAFDGKTHYNPICRIEAIEHDTGNMIECLWVAAKNEIKDINNWLRKLQIEYLNNPAWQAA